MKSNSKEYKKLIWNIDFELERCFDQLYFDCKDYFRVVRRNLKTTIQDDESIHTNIWAMRNTFLNDLISQRDRMLEDINSKLEEFESLARMTCSGQIQSKGENENEN